MVERHAVSDRLAGRCSARRLPSNRGSRGLGPESPEVGHKDLSAGCVNWMRASVIVRNRRGVLPGVFHFIRDFRHADLMANLCEEKRTAATHGARVPLHDVQVRTHRLSQVGLVDDEQVRLGDSRTTLAGNLVPPLRHRSRKS